MASKYLTDITTCRLIDTLFRHDIDFNVYTDKTTGRKVIDIVKDDDLITIYADDFATVTKTTEKVIMEEI